MKIRRHLPLPLCLAALAATAFFSYDNSIRDSLAFDDENFFPYDYSFSGQDVADFFLKDTWEQVGSRSGIYRPVLMLSVALDQKLFGNDPAAFHRTNVLLHVLATLLVFGFLRSLLLRAAAPPGPADGARTAWWPALLGAAVFAVHPVHADAVNSIFNRSEILGAAGAVGTLWLVWANRTARPRLAFELGAVLYFVALLCKESAATVPFLLAVLIVALGREETWRARLRALVPVSLLLVPLGVYLVLRVRALGAVSDVDVIESATFDPPTAGERLAFTLSSVRDALRMLFWPLPFRATYKDYEASRLGLAVAVHAAAAGLLVFSAVRRRALGVAAGLAFFYVAILPSTRLFTNSAIAVPLAERFVYLPSVGLSVAAAFLFARARRKRSVIAAAAAVTAIVAVAVPVGRARNEEWRSNVDLFEADLRGSPEDGDTIRLLANAYIKAGRGEDVLELCDAHLAAHRDNATLLINCAVAYVNARRYRDAEDAYLEAGKSNIRAVPHANLAAMYLKLGDRKRAEEQFLEAVAEENVPALQHTRRGRMLMALYPNDPERLREAISELEKALELRPRMTRLEGEIRYAQRRIAAMGGGGGGGGQPAPSCGQPAPSCGQPAPSCGSPAPRQQCGCRPRETQGCGCRQPDPSGCDGF